MSYMGPIPLLLMFFVTLKTVLQTRNFRHISVVFPMPSGRMSIYSMFSFQFQAFKFWYPVSLQTLILGGAQKSLRVKELDSWPFLFILEK